MSKVVVFDYGAGNLRSVLNTLGAIGAQYELVDDAAGLESAEKIILPGVGHFGQMVRTLDAMRVRKPLLNRITAGVPFLGICLGLQALFEESEEAPELQGLGLRDVDCVLRAYLCVLSLQSQKHRVDKRAIFNRLHRRSQSRQQLLRHVTRGSWPHATFADLLRAET